MLEVKLGPYIKPSDVAKAARVPQQKARRWLEKGDVLEVPPGHVYRQVSTDRLRINMPRVYEAVCDYLVIICGQMLSNASPKPPYKGNSVQIQQAASVRARSENAAR